MGRSGDPYQWTPLLKSRKFKQLTYECERPTINHDPNQKRQRHMSEPGRDTSSASPGTRSTSWPAKGRGQGRVMRHTLPVAQLVFAARGVLPRPTPCVCALQGFPPGRVCPDRTTRRHSLARLPPNWVGLAGRVVSFYGAAGEQGNSIFLGAMAVRQPASGET